MEELLQDECQLLNNALSKYLLWGSKSIQEFQIDCSKLSDNFLREDIRGSVEFKYLFDKLAKIEHSPCLYVFEIESETSTDLVINKIKEFGNRTEKVIPKIKPQIPTNSKTLYVGKVNNLVWGRLITHLGFHTHKNNGNPKASINHGLQLYFWAKEISLNVKFTVIEFEPNMKDILPILENKLANKLRPIIGKHI